MKILYELKSKLEFLILKKYTLIMCNYNNRA